MDFDSGDNFRNLKDSVKLKIERRNSNTLGPADDLQSRSDIHYSSHIGSEEPNHNQESSPPTLRYDSDQESSVSLEDQFGNPEDKATNQGCSGCDDSSPVVYCTDCNAAYCSSCENITHKLKNRALHQRAPFHPSLVRREDKCSKHSTQTLDFFCLVCRKTVCLFCKDYGEHKTHTTLPLEAVAQEKRASLRSQIAALTSSLETAEALMETVTERLSQLTSSSFPNESAVSTRTTQQIDDVFNQLEQLLEKRRDELVASVELEGQRRNEQLQRQAEELGKVITAGNGFIAEAEFLSKSTAPNFAEGYFNLVNNISDLCEKSVLRFSEPVERAKIEVVFEPADITGIINSFGVIGGPVNVRFAVDDSGVCTIRWQEPVPLRQDSLHEGRVNSYLVELLVTTNPNNTATPPDNNNSNNHYISNAEGAVNNNTTGEENTSRLLRVEVGSIVASELKAVPEMVLHVRDYPGCELCVQVRAVYTSHLSSWARAPYVIRLPKLFHLKTFEMQSHFSNGLFHWIGTIGGNAEYENPHIRGECTVSWSSIDDTCSGRIEQFIAQSISDPQTEFSYTKNEPNSWIAVDIGRGRSFVPLGYCLRHDAQGPRGLLRNWVLQGRRGSHESIASATTTDIQDFTPTLVDNEWVTLSVHVNDPSLAPTAGSTAYFPVRDIDVSSSSFRYFRILQTGKNSSGKDRLACAGFELYGICC